MSSDFAIRVQGLGKKYTIGHEAERERYVALRDVLARSVARLKRSTVDLLRGRALVIGDELEDFWALRDVSFDVPRGEVVGVIGRNGAGKSTLLKVLSRITEPTEGRVEIHGRVASLLEVGTGFHPELTGRENVYLNGAILGMSRAEIKRKFDEIVAFAGVERFLDTPVKRYSSGMYVRLAFAVAAHMEPEILVIDEVLAVGDAEFQKKCLGKMSEVASEGRTVLFVSHNMAAVRKLCTAAIFLANGSVRYTGGVRETIAAYMQDGELDQSDVVDLSSAVRKGEGRVRLQSVAFPGFDGVRSYRLRQSVNLTFELSCADPNDMATASVWLMFRNIMGDDVLMLMQKDSPAVFPAAVRGRIDMQFIATLAPGRYSVSCGILGHGRDLEDWIEDAFQVDIEALFDDGGAFDHRWGLVSQLAQWRVDGEAA